MTTICDTFGDFFSGSDVWLDERSEGKGYVTHISSNDRYGHLSYSDSDTMIRLKMLGLVSGLTFLGTLRLAFRVTYLVTGGWIWSKAYPEALLEWKTRRIEIFLKNSSDPLPLRLDLCKEVAAKSLRAFVESFIKTLTYPAAILLEMGVAFLGILAPLTGRRLFSQIEQKWSFSSNAPPLFHLDMNFNAPCMQPKRIWEEQNLYRISKSTVSSSNYDRICALKQMIHRNAAYFPETSSIWQDQLRALFRTEKVNSIDDIERELQTFLDASDRMVDGASFDREASLKNLTRLLNELSP